MSLAHQFSDLEFVNLGGGLPVVYNPLVDSRMPLIEWGASLSSSMEQFSREFRRYIDLHVEPGRYIVAESGLLLAGVQSVKNTPAYTFMVVNTGLNHNIRPAMYGSYHPIEFVPRDHHTGDGLHSYVVAGYLCESGDVFTVDGGGTLKPLLLPAVRVGDLMIMSHVGAYSHSMKREYNSMITPASLLRELDGSIRVIERRGTLRDIMRKEIGIYSDQMNCSSEVSCREGLGTAEWDETLCSSH